MPDGVKKGITVKVDAALHAEVTEYIREHGMTIEDKPRAIITPNKETVRQNGRRVKEPDEPMFTITATDRHGVIHEGRIRTLMPIECWRLQGFTDQLYRFIRMLRR